MRKHIDIESLVDTHDRPFAVIDREFNVIMVNRAYERAFQVEREELVGRKCHQVLHKRDRPCFEEGEDCPYLSCYTSRQPHSCLHTHYDQQGLPRWVRINLFPLTGADGEVFVGEMLHEIAACEAGKGDEEARPVGVSSPFLACMEQLEQAARAEAPVLLIGETGTGKELAAEFIHRCSRRRARPFIALDCTVVTESLFESEVFGHERGAFTGSVGSKKGLFEVADSGTLFLDEIGEASLAMQAKLLRVLESGEFRRVGGHQTLEAKARVVCATNRHLLERVRNGTFREDLYYRIACFCIRVPALRERIEDLPVLCEALLKRIGGETGKEYRITPDAIKCLSGYGFPGNIRELRNILQVIVAHGRPDDTGIISRERIEQCMRMRGEFESVLPDPTLPYPTPDEGRADLVNHRTAVPAAPQPFPLSAPAPPKPHPTAKRAAQATHGVAAPTLKAIEATHIAELLRRHRGNRRQVAVALGISERTLYRKLKRYGLRDLR
jgi:PAS domain S-box-containing protein